MGNESDLILLGACERSRDEKEKKETAPLRDIYAFVLSGSIQEFPSHPHAQTLRPKQVKLKELGNGH